METNYAGFIYLGQTDLTIRFETEKELETGTVCKIKYKGPSDQTGELNAEIYDLQKGIIEHVIGETSPFNEVGTWALWAFATTPSGLISIGRPVAMTVRPEGK